MAGEFKRSWHCLKRHLVLAMLRALGPCGYNSCHCACGHAAPSTYRAQSARWFRLARDLPLLVCVGRSLAVILSPVCTVSMLLPLVWPSELLTQTALLSLLKEDGAGKGKQGYQPFLQHPQPCQCCHTAPMFRSKAIAWPNFWLRLCARLTPLYHFCSLFRPL